MAAVGLLLEGEAHIEELGNHLRTRPTVPGGLYRGDTASAGERDREEELVGETGAGDEARSRNRLRLTGTPFTLAAPAFRAGKRLQRGRGRTRLRPGDSAPSQEPQIKALYSL